MLWGIVEVVCDLFEIGMVYVVWYGIEGVFKEELFDFFL